MARKNRNSRGWRLRNLRLKRGLTLQQVGDACEITPTYLSLIERDHASPGRKLLFRLAEKYHVSPQFIETGELAPEDQEKVARHALWPEIVYFIANHLIVPREIAPADAAPDNEGLRTAIDRAFDAPHFCEYRAWAASSKGKAIAGQFSGNWVLEEFIERIAGKGTLNFASSWTDLSRGIDIHRRISREHHSAVGDHPESGHPADCFNLDVETTYRLYLEMPFLWGDPGKYERDAYLEQFVAAAFPTIFWSAARRWGDRRLAGWFWYLDMPVDLFGPLARLARQYDSAEGFAANARRLLDQATIEDRDVFLGLFPDLSGNNLRYTDRFGAVQCIGGAMRVTPVYAAFIRVLNRRENRRASDSHSLIDLVSTLDDEERLKRCEEALREIAPPVLGTPMGLAVDARKGKRPPKPAREKDRPPETLP